MNDKIEIAKLATQLTIALMGDVGATNKIVYSAKKSDAYEDTPDALIVFDAVFKHLQTNLNAQ